MAESQFRRMMSSIPIGLGRVLLRILSFHSGRDKALGRDGMVEQLRAQGYDINERKARRLIHDLRREGHLICSAPGEDGGYYMASSRKEVESFFERELRPKAMDLLETEKAMKESARQSFGDSYQESLFD